MKLRKKDAARLESILRQLEQGRAFLMSGRILVCIRQHGPATTTLDFTNKQGTVCTSINKEIGSELVLLHTGIAQLREALTEDVT